MISNFFNISIIYGVGFFLLRSISFLLLPLYTNLLNTNDAGIVFIVYTVLAFLNPVYAFGMDSALLKFYNSSQHSQRSVVSSSLFATICSSSLLSILLLSLSNWFSFFLNANYNGLFFIALILFFDSISARLLVLLRLQERPYYYLLIGLVNIVSSIGFNLLFLKYFSFGSFGALYALTFSAFVQFIFLAPPLIKNIKISQLNYLLIQKMFWFGIPFLPATILFIITGISDRWLIKFFLGLEPVGLYGAGYKVGSAISILVLAFNLSWQPYYLKHYKSKNFKKHLNQISYIFFIILIVSTTALCLLWPVLIKIHINNFYLIGPSFWAGGDVIPWVAFGYFFYGLFVLQTPSLYLKNKQLWSPILWCIAACSNVIINILLIPFLGFIGAGISSLCSYLLIYLILLYKNQKWFKNNFIDSFLISLALSSALIIVVHALLSSLVSYGLFVVYCFICFKKIKTAVTPL